MTRLADIIIVATGEHTHTHTHTHTHAHTHTHTHTHNNAGIPGLIKAAMVKEGATVIDIGRNYCTCII